MYRSIVKNNMKENINDMIMISKNIINASYNVTEPQENFFTMICAKVQNIITTNRQKANEINAIYGGNNPIGELWYTISKEEILKVNKDAHENRILESIHQLLNINIDYYFIDIRTGIKVAKPVHTTLINNIIGTEDPNEYKVQINKGSIPFLLFYGKGTGGNIVSMSKAMNIRGKYAKRLYKILCGYTKEGIFTLHKEYIKERWKVSETTLSGGRWKLTIDKAVEEINNNDVGFKVTYKPVLEVKKSGKGRPKVNAYQFTIISDKVQECNNRLIEQKIYRYIAAIYPVNYNTTPIIEKVLDTDKGNTLISKFEYYNEELTKGNINDKQRNAALQKIITEEYLNKALPGNQ